VLSLKTGLFGMDPWQSGVEDGLAPAWAELAADPLGVPCATLRAWLPQGQGHDACEWAGGRWLRVDPVDGVVEYLVDLDGEVSREGSWSLVDHEVALAELRYPTGEEDLGWAFAVMAEVATELRIAPLTEALTTEHIGAAEFDLRSA
jgi:hypothetical protein